MQLVLHLDHEESIISSTLTSIFKAFSLEEEDDFSIERRLIIRIISEALIEKVVIWFTQSDITIEDETNIS